MAKSVSTRAIYTLFSYLAECCFTLLQGYFIIHFYSKSCGSNLIAHYDILITQHIHLLHLINAQQTEFHERVTDKGRVLLQVLFTEMT